MYTRARRGSCSTVTSVFQICFPFFSFLPRVLEPDLLVCFFLRGFLILFPLERSLGDKHQCVLSGSD